jgi:hypothetical protein
MPVLIPAGSTVPSHCIPCHGTNSHFSQVRQFSGTKVQRDGILAALTEMAN